MSAMQLLISSSSGNTITMDVEGSYTLDFVKAKIKAKAEYADGFDPEKCDIRFVSAKRKRSALECVPQSTKQQQQHIFVCILDEKTITLEIPPSKTIWDLMTMIREKEGIKAHEYALFFAGMPLVGKCGSTTLADCEIYEGSTVHLLRQCWASMKIFVETTGGMRFSLEDVPWYYSFSDLKAMIEEKACIPADKQRLVLPGGELEDEGDMATCFIRKESTLRLVDDDEKRRRERMRIRVQILVTRKMIDLNVESMDTIRDVKAKVEAEEGIRMGQQVLFLPLKQLKEDGFTLADYYIRNETTLFLHVCQSTVSAHGDGNDAAVWA